MEKYLFDAWECSEMQEIRMSTRKLKRFLEKNFEERVRNERAGRSFYKIAGATTECT